MFIHFFLMHIFPFFNIVTIKSIIYLNRNIIFKYLPCDPMQHTVPSGENTISEIHSLAYLNNFTYLIVSPSRSKTLTWPSFAPVTIVLPSGDIATALYLAQSDKSLVFLSLSTSFSPVLSNKKIIF